MTIDVSPVPLEDVLPLRELYRHEMNCQIVHDSLPGRGFGNLFLIRADGCVAGYAFFITTCRTAISTWRSTSRSACGVTVATWSRS
jgi:hypothetical protein